MSARYEVLRNGQRICTTGIDGNGVLSLTLNYVRHAGKDGRHDLQVGGLGRFDGSLDSDHHVGWPMPAVEVGDEITIRILPPGEFDSPPGVAAHPSKVVDDPEFGELKYYVDAWDAEIEFSSPPIETAHLHLRADESGPSKLQRELLRELPGRHTELWTDIATALVRCHPGVESVEELNEQIRPHIGIAVYDDTSAVELSYRFHRDPEHRAYFVTLRNWQIAEVCSAD